MVEEAEADEAGLRLATFFVRGKNAYGMLESERGVHRLVRISPFDQQHRRQTSFAEVDVVPEIEEGDVEDIEIRPGRPARRNVQGERCGRPVRQQDGIGDSHHPHSDEYDRGLAARTFANAESRCRD